MSARSRHLLGCFALVWGSLQATCALASEPLPEYTVKAGYLYNFAMLTEWPASAIGAYLEMCFIGDKGLGTALETLQGKVVNSLPINVRLIRHEDEAKACNVLFIADVARADFARIKREIEGRPVLTVTDDSNLAKSGVAIFLRPEQKRLVFEIDTNATKRAQLNISARLLRLAR